MRCEICGRQATIHIVAVEQGNRIEKHRCPAHGDSEVDAAVIEAQRGKPRPDLALCTSVGEALTQKIAQDLKVAVSFIYQYGRMPSGLEELTDGMATREIMQGPEIIDPKLLLALRRMEQMIRFIETHPTADVSLFGIIRPT